MYLPGPGLNMKHRQSISKGNLPVVSRVTKQAVKGSPTACLVNRAPVTIYYYAILRLTSLLRMLASLFPKLECLVYCIVRVKTSHLASISEHPKGAILGTCDL